MGIRILNPGLLTSIQDAGRFGYCAYGMSEAGALDLPSMKIANLLVGNRAEEAVLEMTMYGATIEFTSNCVIAMTGADMEPKLNDQPIRCYESVEVKTGDILTCVYARTGCRAYLAFLGGLKVPVIKGSKSTHLGCKLGGLLGRGLKAMDEIEFEERENVSIKPRQWLLKTDHIVKDKKIIRVVIGPQEDAFTKEGIQDFLSTSYEVTMDSNRMGCKLSGKPIEMKNGADIISDGITLGAIQISSNGQPIVMLAERQTTGGYAKIGTIIQADLPTFVQVKPREQVFFQAVSVNKARRIYKKEDRKFRKLSGKLV